MRDAVRFSMGRAGSFAPPTGAAPDTNEAGRDGTEITLDEAVDTCAPGSKPTADPARCGGSACAHALEPKAPNVATASGVFAGILSLVACSSLMRGNRVVVNADSAEAIVASGVPNGPNGRMDW